MENSELILNTLKYIRTETSKPDISIDDVAFHAGFSTDYFNRIFFRHTGFSVMEYIRFTRLKKAALTLRITDDDILNIALDTGYESHESFSRAFKKQYLKTPREYREIMKNVSVRYADVANDTTAARFCYEFPQFHQIDAEDVFDILLSKDSLKWGAVCTIVYHWNGTKFFTDNASIIAVDEFESGQFYIEIISDDINEIIGYYKSFVSVSENISFFTQMNDDEIISAFTQVGVNVNNVHRVPQYLYTGDLTPVSAPEKDITIKPLEYGDLPDIIRWAEEYGHDWKIEESITRRESYHNENHDIPYGIYLDKKMIGVFRTCNYQMRGLKFCELEGGLILSQCHSEPLCQYIYKYILNETVKSEKCVYDVSSDPIFLLNLGFQNVNNSISVKFT